MVEDYPRCRGFVAIFGFVIILTVSIFATARADSSNPRLYPINTTLNGLGYQQLSGKWWQWVLPIPIDKNPIYDSNGKNCAQNQNGPVWFLAGTGGGPAVRQCTIPAGKSIFFLVLGNECSFAENPSIKSVEDLQNCPVILNKPIDPSKDLSASVDGTNLSNLIFRVQSPPFSFAFPPKPIFGAPPGPSKAAADGWYIFLSPRKPGEHSIHFFGYQPPDPLKGTSAYETVVTYNLSVK
ncbi:MAG TPA: hypothetical protein VH500_12150 [Nitrososphaeraceae archaeon]